MEVVGWIALLNAEVQWIFLINCYLPQRFLTQISAIFAYCFFHAVDLLLTFPLTDTSSKATPYGTKTRVEKQPFSVFYFFPTVIRFQNSSILFLILGISYKKRETTTSVFKICKSKNRIGKIAFTLPFFTNNVQFHVILEGIPNRT